MRLPNPRSLLVDHPALPDPFDDNDPVGEVVSVDSLDRGRRLRVAVQLLSVTALLAEFELWPGRWALKRAMVEENAGVLRVRLAGMPVSLSRVWSRMGGGDQAATRSRAAILKAVEDAAMLDGLAAHDRGVDPGFFLDRALVQLLDEIGTPLDSVTARSLWMWRWSLPGLPEPGDRSLVAVPDATVAKRVGAALWTSAARMGTRAVLEFVRAGETPRAVASRGGRSELRIRAGTFDDGGLATLVDGMDGRGEAVMAVGRFPEGWSPSETSVFDSERLNTHLAIVGLVQERRRRVLEQRLEHFDPFSPAHRQSLTRTARWLFEPPMKEVSQEYEQILGVAGLAREGLPVDRLLDLSESTAEDLRNAIEAGVVVIRGDKVMPPQPRLLSMDPRHGDLASIFAGDDPRRLLHRALASGDSGPLISWAQERLDDLDGEAVRQLLSGVEIGALGTGVQVILVEACLYLADIHGARRAMVRLPEEVARPWLAWLQLMDRSPEQEAEVPRRVDFRYAARPCAEVALVLLRRAMDRGADDVEELAALVRETLPHLRGASRKWIEIRLAARIDPKSLRDRSWRQSVTGSHPELVGLVLFERSMDAIHSKRYRLARRLLTRLMVAERAPGRMALMQLNMGWLEAESGRSGRSEVQTVGAYRLFQAAGFRRRYWDALYNLAVADIDQLRVERASERLNALAEVGPSLFVDVERARLALAVGDLEDFRSQLGRLPPITDAMQADATEALSFLHGAAALFDQSPRAAETMFAAGGGEGAAWLGLARALGGFDGHDRATGPDSWGVRRAAELIRRSHTDDRSREPINSSTAPRLAIDDALAIALCHRLSPRSAWPNARLRARASEALARGGLHGWATSLRWTNREVDALLKSYSKLIRRHQIARPDSVDLAQVLEVLGVNGIVIRDAADQREFLRTGGGKPGIVTTQGRIEVEVFDEVPAGGPAWDLLVDLLDLLHPTGGSSSPSAEPSDVRIDGVSPEVIGLREDVRRVATPAFPVCIHGETGSGKEIVAREIHRLSGRPGDLVAVNVAAVPGNLLEAELFGSVKGAYTGADRSRRGLVTAAEGGTLFLDEIGDLDVALQVKLLRFLESGEIRAVGADRTRCLDVRVICATHRNLDRRVREGRFREDLFYRMVVHRVEVPALRHRPADIPVLRSIFEREVASTHHLTIPTWTSAAERALLDHRWPGNVRELKHTVEAAMARSGGATIRPAHLRLMEREPATRGTWESTLAGFKRRLLTDVLVRHRGNRSAAARELGLSRQGLLYQIKKLGLDEL
jgi:transcriptional regulator with AAA-type ATPase domain